MQCEYLVFCFSLPYSYHVFSGGRDQTQENTFGKVYNCVKECQQVPWEKCTQVGILLFLVLFFCHTGFCPEVLGRVKRTLHSNKGWFSSLVEFLLPAFRQERAQKRVCSEATQEEVAQS